MITGLSDRQKITRTSGCSYYAMDRKSKGGLSLQIQSRTRDMIDRLGKASSYCECEVHWDSLTKLEFFSVDDHVKVIYENLPEVLYYLTLWTSWSFYTRIK